MECRTISTSKHRRRPRGFTLMEMAIAMGVFTIAGLAVGSLFLFSIKSFAQMANYASLDMENRRAVDILTREIRQAQYISSFTNGAAASELVLRSGSGFDVKYSFDANRRWMTRTIGAETQILLTNCNLLRFQCYQRNPMSNDFQIYDIGKNDVANYVKAVELTWKTQKALNPTTLINSENVQTARIILRKQQKD